MHIRTFVLMCTFHNSLFSFCGFGALPFLHPIGKSGAFAAIGGVKQTAGFRCARFGADCRISVCAFAVRTAVIRAYNGKAADDMRECSTSL